MFVVVTNKKFYDFRSNAIERQIVQFSLGVIIKIEW